MKSTMVIGVDFDDVIVSTNESMALWHNRVYGTSYKLKDILSWELSHLWGCALEETIQRIHEFFSSVEHHSTEQVYGAVDALEILNERNLQIITARPMDFEQVTIRLAERHIPFLIDRFNFINALTFEKVPKRTKAEVCIDLGVEVFIEDNLDYAHNVAAVADIPVLLFDRPWNQSDDLPANIYRVYSWNDILERLY